MELDSAKSRGGQHVTLGVHTKGKELGADMAIDYTKQKFEDIVKDVDVVLDSLGEDTLKRSYGVVKKGGFIVSLIPRPEPAELERRGIRGTFISVEPNADELAEIGKLIDQKKIKVIVSQTFPLSEAIKGPGTNRDWSHARQDCSQSCRGTQIAANYSPVV